MQVVNVKKKNFYIVGTGEVGDLPAIAEDTKIN